MEATRPRTEEREDVEKIPADADMMAKLVYQVPGIEDLERSEKFKKLTKEVWTVQCRLNTKRILKSL